MTSNKKIFISVKYNQDHILERSLSAYLNKRGYETYRHTGTVDVVKRAAPSPLLSGGPATLIAPWLIQKGRQVEPQEVTPSLVKQLVEDIHKHDLVVVIWTKAYSKSFWCTLEMKAALLAEKPLFIITADSHPLCHDLFKIVGTDRCVQVDISPVYKTSQSLLLIEDLVPRRQAAFGQSEIIRGLQEFISEYADEYQDTPILSEEDRIRYERLLWKLRMTDDKGNLHNGIKYFSERGAFDQGFRTYLEYAAVGIIEAKLELWYYLYVLGEILDFEFLQPILPEKLKQFYENRIVEAFEPPQQVKVENLINEMITECLFTREFVEYFGYHLGKVRQNHGPLIASIYWDICVNRIPEAV